MKSMIVIPARYGSTRLPGKPLTRIGGVTLLARMIELAKRAAVLSGSDYIVATDHEDIAAHARDLGARAVLTDPDLPSGSDRCLAAVEKSNASPDVIVNLQGDAPFIPPEYLTTLMSSANVSPADMFTPGIQLGWDELDGLRIQKQNAPFSGTTCIRAEDGRALWFSKNIIPAIRNEAVLRKHSPVSPVIRHVGVYCYKLAALRRYVSLAPSSYEKFEGLEQLRAIEAGMQVHLSLVQRPRISMSGIDTPEDVARAEALVKGADDPYHTGIYI